jgi:hypothetical protein
MTTLKFSDGEEFDISGLYWKEYRTDSWYVLGENMLIPIKDEQEADEYISKHSQPSPSKDSNQYFGILSSRKNDLGCV